MATRAGIVVTGTEVLTGRVSDRNGPWLAEQLRQLGVDVANVVVVGDRAEDMTAALQHFIDDGVDLVITSGGLGPTADDLTAEIVGQVQGRPSAVDADLEARITTIVETYSRNRGWHADPEAIAAGVRKQALVPAGATVLEPTGTAPGLVVPSPDGRDGPPVIVLPGPPRELQGMWEAALAVPVVQAAIAERTELRQSTLRLFRTLEADLAVVLREHESELDGLEITTCLRDAELEIVTRYGPSQQAQYDALATLIADTYGRRLFSADGRTVDEIVATALLDLGLTVATAESCTGGLVAGRLTDRPGSSAYVLGGLVTYANSAKVALASVPPELIEEHGAVSAEVALAMATGAREALGADIGVSTTGVAGPGGGTAEKPVGLVYLCVVSDERTLPWRLQLGGDRADVRDRTVAGALHMLREVLT